MVVFVPCQTGSKNVINFVADLMSAWHSTRGKKERSGVKKKVKV